MGEWIKRGLDCSSFFQEKDKAQRGFKKSSHISQGWPQKRYISLHHLVNQTNRENSRCHHTRFTVSSSHKALAPISNETLHFY
ncbi:hypothetical protein H5410_004917 [Solanum commersonii]|uniref:Uncharacterized protein n=1 Tax=Solanum commersonii TaxID=4109 RepID=A0A9J6A5X9_SOLCO|nr:hypothetical protein H5410_004917 [Solanum commersonii]